MEREQAVSVVKLVSYLLIIVGIIILSATIIYFSTVQIDWLSYVGNYSWRINARYWNSNNKSDQKIETRY